MKKRKSLSRKIRFEVFKRDSFTCQYCGKKAPEIVLQVDHIEPVSKGGINNIINLITSCQDCNSGKSNRKLSDNTVIEKQHKQLEELQERKEQIEMLSEWHRGLINLDEQIIQELSEIWATLAGGVILNTHGEKKLRELTKQFDINEIMEAMRIAKKKYFVYDGDSPTQESAETACKKIGGICHNRRVDKEKPYMSQLLYIRGILRNRFSYIHEDIALQLLEQAVVLEASVDSLKKQSLIIDSWCDWQKKMEEFIEEQKEKHSRIEIDTEGSE